MEDEPVHFFFVFQSTNQPASLHKVRKYQLDIECRWNAFFSKVE